MRKINIIFLLLFFFNLIPVFSQQNYKVNLEKLLDLKDEKRGRNIPTYIFYPEKKGSYPLIIISHGFGADALTYRFLGEYLASCGYVVFIPEHIESNLDKVLKSLERLLENKNKELSILNVFAEISSIEEYFDRPKDISFLIDKATELNKTAPFLKNKIDISRIGIIGHSFGGYTALVCAGAEIDVPYLKEICPQEYESFFEVAKSADSFFQCRIIFSDYLKNVDRAISFSDPRIKACIAMAPVTSKIFGKEGLSKIKIPVMIMGGDRDTTVNFQKEQLKTFPKLNPPKYLLILIGGNHISFNGEPEEVIERYTLSKKLKDFYYLWGKLFNPPPVLDFKRGHLYITKFSSAFFDLYLKGDSSAKKFLTQKYAEEISEKSGELFLISQP